MRVFIDANLLVDYLVNRAQDESNISEVFLRVDPSDIYISALSVHIVMYVLKVKFESEIYFDFLNLLKKINVIDLRGRDLIDAMNDTFLDFEDKLQYLSARELCDTIMTRDQKDFVKSKAQYKDSEMKICTFLPLD